MKASDDDLKSGYEDILDDMSSHQRATGAEVTSTANRALALSAFVDLENRGQFETPEIPAVDTQEELAEQFADGDPSVREEESSGPLAIDALPYLARRLLARATELLAERETGILGTPSWRDQLLAIQATLHDPEIPVDKRGAVYGEQLLKLCNDSNRKLGDWRADPARVIYS